MNKKMLITCVDCW